MTNFVCAVRDCKSSTKSEAKQSPSKRQVKGWAMFPSRRTYPKRRRLWEMRCCRGADWRATRNHAICSKHFIAWEKKYPSPKYPDPLLFPYNEWGKNLHHIIRRWNRAQKSGEEEGSSNSGKINSDSATQLGNIQYQFKNQINEIVLEINDGSVQDFCEAEVSSRKSPSTSVTSTVLVTSATTLTAPPHMDHTYIHDRPERGDAVTVGVQTDPLKTTYKGSSFSSAMRSPSIVISAGEDDAFHGTFRREGIPLMSNISHLITPSSSHSSSTDDASVSGVSPSMTSSSVQKKRKKASQPENFNVTREKVDSVHHSQRVVQATTDFVSGFMRLLAEKQQRKFANKIMKLVQEHQASADDCAA